MSKWRAFAKAVRAGTEVSIESTSHKRGSGMKASSVLSDMTGAGMTGA
jgi:hypothetical protein